MAISDRQLLDALGRTPFVDSAELALILGEPHATVHRNLADMLADRIDGLRSHMEFHRRGASTPPSPSTTTAASAWCARTIAEYDYTSQPTWTARSAFGGRPVKGEGALSLLPWREKARMACDG